MEAKQENNELTLASCNQAIELNPNDAAAYINRAKYYYAQGNHELTLVDFIKAIELDPNDTNIYCNLTEYYHLQESYDLTLAISNKLIELTPNDINSCSYYAYRGCCYEKQGENEFALADYTKAIKLNPDYAPVYTFRGNYYRQQEKYDLAIKDINKAIQLDANEDTYYIARGNYYYDQKIYLAAIVDYSKAIELNPSNYSFYNRKGLCYYRQKKYKAAIENYTKAIDLEPNKADLYGNRAACHEELHNYEFALDDYSKAEELDEEYHSFYSSDCSRLLNNQYRYYHQNSEEEDLKNAIHKLTKEIKLAPNLPITYGKRGDCYRQLNYYDSALADYDKAIELNTEDNETYHERGTLHYELGNLELAFEDFNASIELDSSYSESYLRRGICYIEKESNEQALDDFNKTIELNPQAYLAYYSLANYYYEKEKYKLSLEHIDKAIEFSDSLETKKDYCFFAKSVACRAKDYDKAKNYIEKIFENVGLKEKQHKDIYLQDIDKEKELAEKNKQLDKKNTELNNLIAMFAHNFLGTLQCIRSNAEHENNPVIHLKTVKMMGGTLTAFSIISADDDKLIEQLKQDNTGETNLSHNLANNLALAISQLLSKANKDKIINIYLNYLQKTEQIKPEITGEALRLNKDNRKKWQALQHEWEDEFNALFNNEQIDLNALKTWVKNNFFGLEIIGFEDYPVQFKEYGITDSIFLVVLMETLVNALKYMDVKANKPLTLKLSKQDNAYQLSCENPSRQESYRGTHKGMDFLQTIAHKVNGDFISESSENTFKTTFSIPAQLLD